jgi:tRNA(adenine34) deaminase
VEAINRIVADHDGARHAEMVVMSEAQRKLGRLRLRGCTLYTNVKPCAMCSWMAREYGIGRVVYSIKSPAMGGYSAFNVLRALCGRPLRARGFEDRFASWSGAVICPAC